MWVSKNWDEVGRLIRSAQVSSPQTSKVAFRTIREHLHQAEAQLKDKKLLQIISLAVKAYCIVRNMRTGELDLGKVDEESILVACDRCAHLASSTASSLILKGVHIFQELAYLRLELRSGQNKDVTSCAQAILAMDLSPNESALPIETLAMIRSECTAVVDTANERRALVSVQGEFMQRNGKIEENGGQRAFRLEQLANLILQPFASERLQTAARSLMLVLELRRDCADKRWDRLLLMFPRITVLMDEGRGIPMTNSAFAVYAGSTAFAAASDLPIVLPNGSELSLHSNGSTNAPLLVCRDALHDLFAIAQATVSAVHGAAVTRVINLCTNDAESLEASGLFLSKTAVVDAISQAVSTTADLVHFLSPPERAEVALMSRLHDLWSAFLAEDWDTVTANIMIVRQLPEKTVQPVDAALTNMQRFMAWRLLVQDMHHAITHDRPKGTPGHLDMSGVLLDSLEQCIRMARASMASPRHLAVQAGRLKDSCQTLLLLRSRALSGSISALQDAVASVEEYSTQIVLEAEDEVRLYVSEIRNFECAHELLQAIHGTSLDSVLYTNLNVQKKMIQDLQVVLGSVAHSGILSVEVDRCVKVVELLFWMLQHFFAERWKELDDLLLLISGYEPWPPVFEEPIHSFGGPSGTWSHDSTWMPEILRDPVQLPIIFKDRISTTVRRMQEHRIVAVLSRALSDGAADGIPGSLMVLPEAADVLENAIASLSSIPCTSPRAQQYLYSAECILPLRKLLLIEDDSDGASGSKPLREDMIASLFGTPESSASINSDAIDDHSPASKLLLPEVNSERKLILTELRYRIAISLVVPPLIGGRIRPLDIAPIRSTVLRAAKPENALQDFALAISEAEAFVATDLPEAQSLLSILKVLAALRGAIVSEDRDALQMALDVLVRAGVTESSSPVIDIGPSALLLLDATVRSELADMDGILGVIREDVQTAKDSTHIVDVLLSLMRSLAATVSTWESASSSCSNPNIPDQTMLQHAIQEATPHQGSADVEGLIRFAEYTRNCRLALASDSVLDWFATKTMLLTATMSDCIEAVLQDCSALIEEALRLRTLLFLRSFGQYIVGLLHDWRSSIMAAADPQSLLPPLQDALDEPVLITAEEADSAGMGSGYAFISSLRKLLGLISNSDWTAAGSALRNVERELDNTVCLQLVGWLAIQPSVSPNIFVAALRSTLEALAVMKLLRTALSNGRALGRPGDVRPEFVDSLSRTGVTETIPHLRAFLSFVNENEMARTLLGHAFLDLLAFLCMCREALGADLTPEFESAMLVFLSRSRFYDKLGGVFSNVEDAAVAETSLLIEHFRLESIIRSLITVSKQLMDAILSTASQPDAKAVAKLTDSLAQAKAAVDNFSDIRCFGTRGTFVAYTASYCVTIAEHFLARGWLGIRDAPSPVQGIDPELSGDLQNVARRAECEVAISHTLQSFVKTRTTADLGNLAKSLIPEMIGELDQCRLSLEALDDPGAQPLLDVVSLLVQIRTLALSCAWNDVTSIIESNKDRLIQVCPLVEPELLRLQEEAVEIQTREALVWLVSTDAQSLLSDAASNILEQINEAHLSSGTVMLKDIVVCLRKAYMLQAEGDIDGISKLLAGIPSAVDAVSPFLSKEAVASVKGHVSALSSLAEAAALLVTAGTGSVVALSEALAHAYHLRDQHDSKSLILSLTCDLAEAIKDALSAALDPDADVQFEDVAAPLSALARRVDLLYQRKLILPIIANRAMVAIRNSAQILEHQSAYYEANLNVSTCMARLEFSRPAPAVLQLNRTHLADLRASLDRSMQLLAVANHPVLQATTDLASAVLRCCTAFAAGELESACPQASTLLCEPGVSRLPDTVRCILRTMGNVYHQQRLLEWLATPRLTGTMMQPSIDEAVVERGQVLTRELASAVGEDEQFDDTLLKLSQKLLCCYTTPSHCIKLHDNIGNCASVLCECWEVLAGSREPAIPASLMQYLQHTVAIEHAPMATSQNRIPLSLDAHLLVPLLAELSHLTCALVFQTVTNSGASDMRASTPSTSNNWKQCKQSASFAILVLVELAPLLVPSSDALLSFEEALSSLRKAHASFGVLQEARNCVMRRDWRLLHALCSRLEQTSNSLSDLVMSEIRTLLRMAEVEATKDALRSALAYGWPTSTTAEKSGKGRRVGEFFPEELDSRALQGLLSSSAVLMGSESSDQELSSLVLLGRIVLDLRLALQARDWTNAATALTAARGMTNVSLISEEIAWATLEVENARLIQQLQEAILDGSGIVPCHGARDQTPHQAEYSRSNVRSNHLRSLLEDIFARHQNASLSQTAKAHIFSARLIMSLRDAIVREDDELVQTILADARRDSSYLAEVCKPEIQMVATEFREHFLCRALESSLRDNRVDGSITSLDLTHTHIEALDRGCKAAEQAFPLRTFQARRLYHFAKHLLLLRKLILGYDAIQQNHMEKFCDSDVQTWLYNENDWLERIEAILDSLKRVPTELLPQKDDVDPSVGPLDRLILSFLFIQKELHLIIGEVRFRRVFHDLLKGVSSPMLRTVSSGVVLLTIPVLDSDGDSASTDEDAEGFEVKQALRAISRPIDDLLARTSPGALGVRRLPARMEALRQTLVCLRELRRSLTTRSYIPAADIAASLLKVLRQFRGSPDNRQPVSVAPEAEAEARLSLEYCRQQLEQLEINRGRTKASMSTMRTVSDKERRCGEN
jgi:hypothetical protein